ncbi:hypothetical protein [Nesterenkonia sp. Act20]|uniref:hypothetical protein n=1 Tax=Nesterenkonia sp. Act20 TaxID=1483432 RepID=UPI001C46E3B5|nr:hypothetical protein [Nesterenkonia sp. Act20]
MRGARRTLLALAAAAITLSSCAENPGEIGAGSGDGDEPTSPPAAVHPDDGAAAPGPSDGAAVSPDLMPDPIQETEEMVAEHLSAWQDYTVVSETELQLAFYTGNPACYGVRSVLAENDQEVRVATISGTLLDATDSACTQEARYVSVTVELDGPLADREVLPLTEVELNR